MESGLFQVWSQVAETVRLPEARPGLGDAGKQHGVVVVVVGEELPVQFRVGVGDRTAAGVEQSGGDAPQFVDIARGMPVGIVDDGVGIAERIVAFAPGAVRDAEIIGIARSGNLQGDRIMHRRHQAQRIEIILQVQGVGIGRDRRVERGMNLDQLLVRNRPLGGRGEHHGPKRELRDIARRIGDAERNRRRKHAAPEVCGCHRSPCCCPSVAKVSARPSVLSILASTVLLDRRWPRWGRMIWPCRRRSTHCRWCSAG